MVKSRLVFTALMIFFIAVLQFPWRWAPHARAQTTTPVATAKLVTGLTLSFQNQSGQTVDARDARLVALMVPAGTSASPMLAPGKFTAVFSGVVTTKIKDTYRFAAEGRGDLVVTLNDKPLMELHGDLANHPTDPVQLKKGKNKLVVTYQSPADGDAVLRLLWAASGKTLEPISPIFFQHDADEDVLTAHRNIRTGRELVATLRCAACHQGVTGTMPELTEDAPNLTDIKNRLNRDWVACWITNPKALRPTAAMPCVFHDKSTATVDDRAGDIAAYLTQPAAPSAPVTDPLILAHGARLFTGLGCVACHIAPGIEDSDPTLNRVPLRLVKAKFKPDALKTFLRKPTAHYAWIKMPDFHLTEDEASAISAWLLSSCKDDALPAINKQFDPVNGKKLFESAGCMSCHSMDQSKLTTPTASDFTHADFKHRCMADDVAKIDKGVDFALTADQRECIRAFVGTDWKSSLQRDPLPEFTARQMTALRCYACHSMDGRDNAWANLDTEIGTIEQNLPPRPDNDPEPKGDQSRPQLTWTGEKLRPSWMSAFLAGEISYKPRQWIYARMPAFASRASLLSKGLALAHGCSAGNESRPPVDQNLADIGKALTGQTRFGCVKCHAVADQAALAPFEAEAPNFAHVDARLRHEYFTHWMRNPQYYAPGTKMPSFANVDGQTAYKEILGGDAPAQYEAIWNYLRAGEKITPSQDEDVPGRTTKSKVGP
jgi:mono/diheme cytochrome c family protein